MPLRRKLFMIHASELANRLVHSVGDGGLVSRFVASYASAHNRPGLVSNLERARELVSTIGREALLVMTVEIEHLVPVAFSENRKGPLKPEEAALAKNFFAEFLGSLGRSLDWSPGDAAVESEALQRDLEMYRRWTRRSPLRPPGTATRAQVSRQGASQAPSHATAVAKPQFEDSPFPDRCALLLDPSMMEQARRAAVAFEAEIAHAATRVFSQLGRHAAARKASRRPRPTPRRPGPAPRRRPSPRAPKLRRAPRFRPQRKPSSRRNLRPPRRKLPRHRRKVRTRLLRKPISSLRNTRPRRSPKPQKKTRTRGRRR